MRLSEAQLSHISSVIQKLSRPYSCKVYLYGSRTKDQLKGGDIDLLLLSDSSGVSHLHEKKYQILVEMKKSPLIGDRRIDLKIATQDDLKSDPFLKLIAEDLVLLNPN